jgi:hypothetical protein
VRDDEQDTRPRATRSTRLTFDFDTNSRNAIRIPASDL